MRKHLSIHRLILVIVIFLGLVFLPITSVLSREERQPQELAAYKNAIHFLEMQPKLSSLSGTEVMKLISAINQIITPKGIFYKPLEYIYVVRTDSCFFGDPSDNLIALNELTQSQKLTLDAIRSKVRAVIRHYHIQIADDKEAKDNNKDHKMAGNLEETIMLDIFYLGKIRNVPQANPLPSYYQFTAEERRLIYHHYDIKPRLPAHEFDEKYVLGIDNALSLFKSNPIAAAVSLHMIVVHLHPFKDGNGRTARLIANKLLTDANIPAIEFPIAEYSGRKKYEDSIRQAEEENDYRIFEQYLSELIRKP